MSEIKKDICQLSRRVVGNLVDTMAGESRP